MKEHYLTSVLKIHSCDKLARFSIGMGRLQNLSVLMGYPFDWWISIIWEYVVMKIKLEKNL